MFWINKSSPSTEKSFSLPWFGFVWVLPCVERENKIQKKIRSDFDVCSDPMRMTQTKRRVSLLASSCRLVCVCVMSTLMCVCRVVSCWQPFFFFENLQRRFSTVQYSACMYSKRNDSNSNECFWKFSCFQKLTTERSYTSHTDNPTEPQLWNLLSSRSMASASVGWLVASNQHDIISWRCRQMQHSRSSIFVSNINQEDSSTILYYTILFWANDNSWMLYGQNHVDCVCLEKAD